jgi:hypothetical protein
MWEVRGKPFVAMQNRDNLSDNFVRTDVHTVDNRSDNAVVMFGAFE